MMFRRLSVLFVCLCFLFALSACGYDINNIPKGTLIESHLSPDERYTVNIYLCEGSATVDSALRGELVDNENGFCKNIYWNYHEDSATVVWNDDSTVVINGHILVVPNDTFDFRKH